jgi:hypothetical protein
LWVIAHAFLGSRSAEASFRRPLDGLPSKSHKMPQKRAIAKSGSNAYSTNYEAEPPEERANVLPLSLLCAGVFWHGEAEKVV